MSFALRWPSPFANIVRQTSRSPSLRPATRSLCTSTRSPTPHASAFLRSYRLALAVSLPILAVSLPSLKARPPLECASDRDYYARPVTPREVEQGGEVQSIVSWKEMSFGTVAGLCVGVFVKKGLKVSLAAAGSGRT